MSVRCSIGILIFITLSWLLTTRSAFTSAQSPQLHDDHAIFHAFDQLDWEEATTRARNFISGFSLEDKVNVATGVGWMNGPCVGNIPAQPKHHWSGLCLQDSPLGVRFADFVSAFPAGINVAATWDRGLIRARGVAMAKEFRGKGVHVALGPMMNLGRVAQGGRNWEGFGADPYLVGEASYETIIGIQSQGVQACAKHLLNNEQEYARTTSTSEVDDRTEHELYAHPFLRSVQAGVASVMCSYNQVNGTYACEHDHLLNKVLKHEYGFYGYVMSDWQATHSTGSAAKGLDMTMPGDIVFFSNDTYFGQNLTDFVRSGKIHESRIDDMATRIIAAYFLLGQDHDYPAVNFHSWDHLAPINTRADVQDDHYKLIRQIGAASTVLLKNVDHTLPLKKPRSIVLVGSDAGPAIRGPNGYVSRGGVDGVLAMGWGSGTAEFPYLVSPLEAIQTRAREDRTSVTWWLDDFDTTGAALALQAKEVAIVFINSDSGEEHIVVDGQAGDRHNLTAWHNGDSLVLAVAAHHPKTIVVVHTVGPIIVEPWIEHPNVTAVLWAGLPGQEAGNALVDVLYGAWNPSAKLPYTIAKRPEDYPAQLIMGGNPETILPIPYHERLNIDYRHFDAHGITPRFEFGFGLSYTTFEYSDLAIKSITNDNHGLAASWKDGIARGNTDFASSAAKWLHEPRYAISFNVKNTGSLFGWEIPQLYISLPPAASAPLNQLRGFTRIGLDGGETARVSLNVSRYDLSVWDVVQQGWIRPNGKVGLRVGSSSRDSRLHGEI